MKNTIRTIFISLLFLQTGWAGFNGQRAFTFLEQQLVFGPRNPGSDGHEKCLQFLKTYFKNNTDSVRLQPFSFFDEKTGKGYKLTNVIASFNPQARERIFFAAHWDTRPRADMDQGAARQKPILGANDGASGVAVLMEMARQLKASPVDIGVDFILFDGEDYGEEGHLEDYFLGSRYFAKNATDYRPRYGILLDMIGDAQLNLPWEGYSYQNLPNLVQRVWNLANDLGYIEFENRVGNYISDDHVVLLQHGIPCIDIIDFAYPDASHRYWHTHADTADKCSPRSLETVGRVLMELIYSE